MRESTFATATIHPEQSPSIDLKQLERDIRANGLELPDGIDMVHVGRCLTDKRSVMGHIRQKPFGYAGDYRIIDRIYTREESVAFGPFDRWALEQCASKAVRNRKEYIKSLLLELEVNRGKKVLNVACGPSRDLYEFLQEYPDSGARFTCVDMDQRALDFSSRLTHDHAEKIEFIHKNIFRYNTEQRFDVIWSAGLFDYFNDRAFVMLLERFRKWLKPGGVIVVGNFNADYNPSRGVMEILGDWKLEHRSPSQLLDLAVAAGYTRLEARVESEEEGVNLFLRLAPKITLNNELLS
ncbi:MAG: class I SAM-dependent methyltransferase [Flavobacteriales bacterium]|nr:class I SAM-dependent methyltransferase [Flavobacteriales bacterium]